MLPRDGVVVRQEHLIGTDTRLSLSARLWCRLWVELLGARLKQLVPLSGMGMVDLCEMAALLPKQKNLSLGSMPSMQLVRLVVWKVWQRYVCGLLGNGLFRGAWTP